MNADWAAQNLQTIRTLMERSALYRRALAPIMLTIGCIGLVSAVLAYNININETHSFILWWLVTALISCGTALFLVRRQAISARESVWSPPARRVVQAAMPPLGAGFLISMVLLLMIPGMPDEPSNIGRIIGMVWVPLGWVILYGCALHAAGFFLPRGMKIFGLGFLFLGGSALFAGGFPDLEPGMYAHGIMGLFFGLLHVAYGIYLYLTETKRNRRVNPEPFLQLDRVIHEKGRMAIMSLLAATAKLSFTDLKHSLNMTDGNLTTHIKTLKLAGYIGVTKSVQNRRPLTTCSLTAAGKRAFSEYITLLETIVRQAKPKTDS